MLAVEAVGGLSGWLTRQGADLYAKTTAKPPLSPPSVVFPVVWSALFALMGVGAARVWLTPPSPARTRALTVFGVQLAFNFCWSLIFFNAQAYGFALVWLAPCGGWYWPCSCSSRPATSRPPGCSCPICCGSASRPISTSACGPSTEGPPPKKIFSFFIDKHGEVLYNFFCIWPEPGLGEMSEWLKEPVLKTGDVQASVGSNPTLSAIFILRFDSAAYSVCRSTQVAEGAPLLRE